jgi:hypothetical protein
VLVENVGKLPVPVDLTFILEDGSQKNFKASTSVWENESKEVWIETDIISKIKSVELMNKNIPDADASNNKFVFKN